MTDAWIKTGSGKEKENQINFTTTSIWNIETISKYNISLDDFRKEEKKGLFGQQYTKTLLLKLVVRRPMPVREPSDTGTRPVSKPY